jgi:DNA-directed RNA polymerase subunit RPC12/RpoP
MKCACCGGEMLVEKELEKMMIYKCIECGLSNTELKKNNT